MGPMPTMISQGTMMPASPSQMPPIVTVPASQPPLFNQTPNAIPKPYSPLVN
jgi:hypothetical protein